jgi:hypothetical protein
MTLLLIIINCLVYFLFQLHDDRSRLTAEQYYLSSGLAEIEVPRYIRYLETEDLLSDKDKSTDDMDADELIIFHFELEADADFVGRLMAGRI